MKKLKYRWAAGAKVKIVACLCPECSPAIRTSYLECIDEFAGTVLTLDDMGNGTALYKNAGGRRRIAVRERFMRSVLPSEIELYIQAPRKPIEKAVDSSISDYLSKLGMEPGGWWWDMKEPMKKRGKG